MGGDKSGVETLDSHLSVGTLLSFNHPHITKINPGSQIDQMAFGLFPSGIFLVTPY